MGLLKTIGSLLGIDDKLPKEYDTETYYAYAQKQEAKGNVQRAIECYEMIYSHDRTHYETYDRLFKHYEQTKQWAKLKELAESFNEHLWYLKMDHWKGYLNEANHGLWEEEQKKKFANKANKAKAQEVKTVKPAPPKDERKFVGPPNPKDYKREEDMPVMRQFLTKDGREFVWTKEATITFEDYNRIQRNLGKPEMVSLKRSKIDTYLDYVNPLPIEEDSLFDAPPKPVEKKQPVMVKVTDKAKLPTESHFTLKGKASINDIIADFRATLPEFDFYTGDASEKYKEKKELVEKINRLNDSISNDLANAIFYINGKQYENAVRRLEEMVSLDLPTLKPHIKLMELYHQIGWEHVERPALDQIIRRYEGLKAKNLKEFLALADKYHSRAYADKKVAEGKRVSYFDNLFDVYNPYPELEILKKMRKELG